MIICHFTPEERKFIERIFLTNSSQRQNTKIEYKFVSTIPNKRVVTRCTEIIIRWDYKNNLKNVNCLRLFFKNNTQFAFHYIINGETITNSYNFIVNSESEYNLKCLNEFENTLKDIDFIGNFETPELMKFIFRTKNYTEDE